MKNIVWLASYPKSGNTWFRIFLTNYLNNSKNQITLEDINAIPIASNAIFFEEITGLNPFEMTPEEVDRYRPDTYRFLSNETENICYFKIHDAYILNSKEEPILPSDVSKGTIYFIRNPLDVTVSYSNHSGKDIEEAINFLLNEKAEFAGKKRGQLRQTLLSWKGHVESWRNQQAIPIHFVRYEDLKLNPLATFGSIIQFLDLEYDEERLMRAIKHSDFKLLQQMEVITGFNEKPQLCNSFFWKGEIGNYLNFISEKDIKRIVDYNYDVMRIFGYIDSHNQLTI